MATNMLLRSAPLNRFSSVYQLINLSSVKLSSHLSSIPKETAGDAYTKVREVANDRWQYVERLIPPLVVPPYPVQETYSSGWKPPADSGCHFPFFVRRTKNHMVPVYLRLEAIRGERKITLVKHIEGDIWELERLLKSHLEEIQGKTLVSQVHEVSMFIKFKGDHVLNVKKWLLEAGF